MSDETVVRGRSALLIWALLLTTAASVAGAVGYTSTVSATGDLLAAADVLEWVFLWLMSVVLAGVGTVVAARRREHPIGWMLLVAGCLLASSGLLYTYAWHSVSTGGSGRAAAWAAMLEGATFFPAFVLVGFLLPLVFPDGRLLSPRWRIVVWMAVLATVAEVLAVVLRPGPLSSLPELVNPVAVPATAPVADGLEMVAFLLFPPVLVAVGVAVVIRFVRSRGAVRQQFKWVALPAAVFVVFIPLNEFLLRGSTGLAAVVGTAMFVVGFGGLPVGVGIAVLRYRLYDIDRIISRTVAYGALTVVLVGVYAIGVVGLGTAVRAVTGQASNDLVVAASTLAVAVLFGPARRRIQATVERRFYRTRYDAQHTLEQFSQRLRDEVDMAALSSALRGIVVSTVQPTHVSLWIAPGRDAR